MVQIYIHKMLCHKNQQNLQIMMEKEKKKFCKFNWSKNV